jgi:hypothetical protein
MLLQEQKEKEKERQAMAEEKSKIKPAKLDKQTKLVVIYVTLC